MKKEQRKKKRDAVLLYSLLFVICNLFIGCTNVFSPPANKGNKTEIPVGYGLVKINLSSPLLDTASFIDRTALPPLSDFYFTLNFIPQGAGQPMSVSPQNTETEIECLLTSGLWNLTIAGYSDAARINSVLLGNTQVTVNAGQMNKVTVQLNFTGSFIGSGEIDYAVEFPLNVTDAVFSLISLTNTESFRNINLLAAHNRTDDNLDYLYNNTAITGTTVKAQGTIYEVPAGVYQILVELLDETTGGFAGFTELAHIRDGMTTKTERNFTSANFALSAKRYVTQNGAGSKNGLSWANASDDIQKMLDQAYTAKQADSGVEAIVHVAAGIYTPRYKPNSDGTNDYTITFQDRDSTFFLRPGVELRGGYTEYGENISEAERKERFDNYGQPLSESYRVRLSGDFEGDDGGNEKDGYTGMWENAHHVVLGVDILDNGKSIVDGFTISGGNANGSSFIIISGLNIYRSNGGGIYNYDNSSLILVNVTISGNNANYGGGMYNWISSSPILTNVTIFGNTAFDHGGGIYNNSSSPALTNINISGNNASYGGGMYNWAASSPVLTNTIISGNNAYEGGGIYNENSSPILSNVTISGNNANSNGGGMLNENYDSSKIRNSIIWGNSDGIYIVSGTPEVYSSITQETWTGTGSNNLEADPEFLIPIDYTLAPDTTGDFGLNTNSPAINAGDNDYYPDTWAKWEAQFDSPSDNPITEAVYNKWIKPAMAKDVAGNERIKGSAIDMGAFEEQGGVRVFDLPLSSSSDVGSFLAGQTGGASTDDPVSLPIGLSLTQANWVAILTAIEDAGKFVDLDLAECTGSGSGGGLRSGGVFDPVKEAVTGKSKIVSIALPNAATSIIAGEAESNAAFKDFTNLESFSGNGLKAISDYAFSNCENLISISLPNGLISIGESAFTGCTSLAQIILPEGLTSIGDFAFCVCTSLSEITFPESLVSIGKYAVTNTVITELALPNGLGTIGENAFYNNYELTNVTLPDGLISIANDVFQSCDKLEHIILPEGLISIGSMAFAFCTSLTQINLPESLETIGNDAFMGTNLEQVTLPENLVSVGEGTFYLCSKLVLVISYAYTPPVSNFAQSFGINQDLQIKVPGPSLSAYKTAPGWDEYANKIVPLDAGDPGLGGGIIFYYEASSFTMTDDNSVCYYLEAAQENMPTTLPWASSAYQNTDITGTDTSIGTGRKNNSLILAIDADAPAAKACDEYENNGKTDWFLPSRDELNELNKQKGILGISSGIFWSSSQYFNEGNNAHAQNFNTTNYQNYDYKSSPNSVRAIRAF